MPKFGVVGATATDSSTIWHVGGEAVAGCTKPVGSLHVNVVSETLVEHSGWLAVAEASSTSTETDDCDGGTFVMPSVVTYGA